MGKDSDIDILVDIKAEEGSDPWKGSDPIQALKQKIEEALGRRVDLVEYDTLKPLLRDKIIKEQVVLL